MRTIVCLQSVLVITVLLMGCTEQQTSTMSGAAKGTSVPPSGQGEMTAPKPAEEAAGQAGTTKEAQSLIDKASAAIKGGNLDQAEQLLTQLDGMKSMLPKAMQDKIASLRQALDMAKAAKGLQLPGTPAK